MGVPPRIIIECECSEDGRRDRLNVGITRQKQRRRDDCVICIVQFRVGTTFCMYRRLAHYG